jgi:hypothetical protein
MWCIITLNFVGLFDYFHRYRFITICCVSCYKKWDHVNSNTYDNKVKCFKDETDTGERHHQHLRELPENWLLLQSHWYSMDTTNLFVLGLNADELDLDAFDWSIKLLGETIGSSGGYQSLFTLTANKLDSFSIEKLCNYFKVFQFPELDRVYSDMAVKSGATSQDKILSYEEFLQYKLGLSEDGISESLCAATWTSHATNIWWAQTWLCFRQQSNPC